MEYYQRPPWWFTAIAVLTALPGLRLPWLMGSFSGENEILLWLYPAMTILAAWLAYHCYATERKPMAWILLAVSVACSVLIGWL